MADAWADDCCTSEKISRREIKNMNEEMKIKMLQKLVEDIVSKHEGDAAVMLKIGPYVGSTFAYKSIDGLLGSLTPPLYTLMKSVAEERGAEEAALLTHSLMTCLLGGLLAVCNRHNVSKEQLDNYANAINKILNDFNLLLSTAKVAHKVMYEQKNTEY